MIAPTLEESGDPRCLRFIQIVDDHLGFELIVLPPLVHGLVVRFRPSISCIRTLAGVGVTLNPPEVEWRRLGDGFRFCSEVFALERPVVLDPDVGGDLFEVALPGGLASVLPSLLVSLASSLVRLNWYYSAFEKFPVFRTVFTVVLCRTVRVLDGAFEAVFLEDPLALIRRLLGFEVDISLEVRGTLLADLDSKNLVPAFFELLQYTVKVVLRIIVNRYHVSSRSPWLRCLGPRARIAT